MKRRIYTKKMPRLTLKKARALLMQEFGTAKGLKKDDCALDGYFQMRLGNLCIQIHNDYPDQTGCIVLEVSMPGGSGYFTRLYKPDTLEEDYEAETLQDRRNERERLEEWVNTNGAEVCCSIVEKIWNAGG